MKITGLPEGTVAVRWNNAKCKDEDICVECSLLRNSVFRVDSDEFKRLMPPPIHGDCKCYLTFIDVDGKEMKGKSDLKPKDLMERLVHAVKVGLKHLPDSNQWDGDSAWDEYTSFEQDAVKKARKIMNHARMLYETYHELKKALSKEYEIAEDGKGGEQRGIYQGDR